MTSNYNDFSNRDRLGPSNEFGPGGYGHDDTNTYAQAPSGFEHGGRHHPGGEYQGGEYQGGEYQGGEYQGGEYGAGTGTGAIGVGAGQRGGHDFTTPAGDRYGGVAGVMHSARHGGAGAPGLRNAPPPPQQQQQQQGAFARGGWDGADGGGAGYGGGGGGGGGLHVRGAGTGAGWDGAGSRADYDNGLQAHGARGDFSDHRATGGRAGAGLVGAPGATVPRPHKPTTGEKVRGELAVVAGKVMRDPEMVAEGQAVKSGLTNTSTSGAAAQRGGRY